MISARPTSRSSKKAKQKLNTHFQRSVLKQSQELGDPGNYDKRDLARLQRLSPGDIEFFPIGHPKAAFLGRVHVDFPATSSYSGYEVLYLLGVEGLVLRRIAMGPMTCGEEYTSLRGCKWWTILDLNSVHFGFNGGDNSVI